MTRQIGKREASPFAKLCRALGTFLGKVTKFSFITVLVVVVLIVSLLPFVIRWQAVDWLEKRAKRIRTRTNRLLSRW